MPMNKVYTESQKPPDLVQLPEAWDSSNGLPGSWWKSMALLLGLLAQHLDCLHHCSLGHT
eukprot:scaffold24810_cov20-Tisochrysis_lutea.AAC.1